MKQIMKIDLMPALTIGMSLLPLSPSAYRFFPLLLFFSVILIAFISRDFGPLLTAERKTALTPPQSKDPEVKVVKVQEESDHENVEMQVGTQSLQDENVNEFTGKFGLHQPAIWLEFDAQMENYPFYVCS